MITYRVKSGETLSQIARRYGVQWIEIARLNGIADPRLLRAGQDIQIPTPAREGPPPGSVDSRAYDVQDGPYTRHRFSRGGARIRWLVVHDPVGGSVAGTLSVLRANASEVSYHEMLAPGNVPTVYRLAPAGDLVGHAGVESRIPGTEIRNGAVNRFTYSFCFYKHRDDNGPLAPALYNAGVVRLADLIRDLALPDAGVVLAHREVSTTRGRRSDPRGVEMNRLRADIADRLRG